MLGPVLAVEAQRLVDLAVDERRPVPHAAGQLAVGRVGELALDQRVEREHPDRVDRPGQIERRSLELAFVSDAQRRELPLAFDHRRARVALLLLLLAASAATARASASPA